MQKKKFYVTLQEKRKVTTKPHSGLSTFTLSFKDAFVLINDYCEQSECSEFLFCISENGQDMYKGRISMPCQGIFNYTYYIYAGQEKELKSTKYNYNKLVA